MPLPLPCHASAENRTTKKWADEELLPLAKPCHFSVKLVTPSQHMSVPSEYEIKASRHLPSFFAAWPEILGVESSYPGLSRCTAFHQIVEHPKLPGIPPLHALHALPCWYSSRLQLSKPRRRHTKRITSTCCKLEVRHPKQENENHVKSGNLWS